MTRSLGGTTVLADPLNGRTKTMYYEHWHIATSICLFVAKSIELLCTCFEPVFYKQSTARNMWGIHPAHHSVSMRTSTQSSYGLIWPSERISMNNDVTGTRMQLKHRHLVDASVRHFLVISHTNSLFTLMFW